MKINLLFCVLFGVLDLTFSDSASAQIIYEHSYPYVYSASMNKVQLTDIGGGIFKYIYTDYQTNELKLFNLDHTSYQDIPVPIVLSNQGEYTIGYVTRTLFDCDTTELEYAIMASRPQNNFYVYSQSGALIFQRDSTIATYGFGEFSGSYTVRPIVNTPEGAKLFLAKLDPAGQFPTLDVFSLCGQLPLNSEEQEGLQTNDVLVYPNPSLDQTHFRFDFQNQFSTVNLRIYDASGKIVFDKNIEGKIADYTISAEGFRQGIYFYEIKSENILIKTGKFIIYK